MSSPNPNSTSHRANWHYGPEPDVTWGLGGIDDWGWTSQPTDPSPDVALDLTSTPPKESSNA
jgi:hypothetical protein